MAHIRIFVFLLIFLIIINCAFVQANSYDILSRQKRLFSCAKAGKRCGGLMGKTCCSNLQCNITIKKCFPQKFGKSWLDGRNGK